jgi:hypothetical protein
MRLYLYFACGVGMLGRSDSDAASSSVSSAMGFQRVQAESDSLEVINILDGKKRIWNELAVIYANCIMSAGMIGNTKFQHCPRKTNKAAHAIAKHGFNLQLFCNWDDEPLVFFLQTLLDGVTTL